MKYSSSALKSLVFLITLGLLHSCGWTRSERRLLKKGDSLGETVSKAQFDELSRKYEALLKEKQRGFLEGKESEVNNMMNQIESEQVIDPDSAVERLSDVRPISELGGTVDVFSDSSSALPSSPSSLGGNLKSREERTSLSLSDPRERKEVGSYDSTLVESEITQVRKAQSLVEQNHFDQALTIIKKLERSSLKQIVVRAKFLLGEILFKGGDYDLSMQVFEEVITNYAFSGLVIKTLGRLIACSEKLKLSEKREKYYSILHDFFEQGS